MWKPWQAGVWVLALVLGGLGLAQPQPIRVGFVGGLSGGFIQPEPPRIVRAYFERVNAQGGIQGRRLELYVEDDKTDPASASQAARRLVDSLGVVAHVGSASALDCSVNGAFYVQRGLVSIQGTGVDPLCFRNPNISAVNTGPFVATTLVLQYAAQNLKKDKICAFFTQLPGLEPAYREAVAEFEQLTGKKILLQDYSYKPGDDPTPLVLRVRQAGCEATLFAGSDAFAISWMNAALAQNLLRATQWLFLPSTYTEAFARAMGSRANGVQVASELEPYLGNSPALNDWRELSRQNNIPLTSFSLASYLAAEIFVNTLKTIQGEITRESVTAAFKRMPPYRTPLLGDPYTFGDAPAHRSNQSIKMLELRDGAYRIAYPGWIRLQRR
ncbi:MAG: ABC transporter substrate-binding protein [Meiothermus sp.]|uniref:ABC transporter substrate-binding protein n=1 Tax=Meiothermus sp. TaxID=1955249 RepID=UPI00262756A3|nr:ABC transporter substrate-binding protein [Meiothermus sp.]MCS7059415.1 ABC transporter substrate-binding protein [Meiothermus sp.]MCX7739602.1 ABC transporter substrate-binding protein [Meiothermus sp.]